MSIKKYIPDFVTSMNVVCGILGVVFAFKGRVDVAFALMLCAGVFDFFDGLCARALHAYSDFGKELDSLCDCVSFGVLPSVMLYNLCKSCCFAERWYCYLPLLVAVFSALRLANFNVDERQHSSFIGLPCPAGAILCGGLCTYVAADPASVLAQWCSNAWAVPVFSLVICALLVCPLPMFSLKFSKNDSREVKSKRITFLVAVLICLGYVLIAGRNISLVFVLLFTVYILLNVCFCIFRTEKRQE